MTDRRTFLQTTSLAAMSGLIAQPSTAATKPNVMVILVDDLGFGDLGCYGSPDLNTPWIDKLCGQGMRFRNAYANCPVCSPTRAALMSGRYQEFAGVPGVIRTHADDSWGYLRQGIPLLSNRFQDAGYQTACIGKWHLGLEPENHPNRRGFDYFKGFLGDMMDDYYTHLRHGNNYMRFNEKVIEPRGHATNLFMQWTMDYLRNFDRSKPFFMYLNFNAPHNPIQPPQEYTNGYLKRHPNADPARAKLAGLIEHLDHGIGMVMQTMQELDLDDNTLLIFTSDNGGLLRAGAYNGPYREGKGTLYEGGIRVPMIARWPGNIEAGSVTGKIALSMDILPTVLEAVGAKVSSEIDGRSFLPALKTGLQPEPERDLFFGRLEGGNFKGKRIYAIRRGDWKLLRPMPDQPLELYNLRTDPKETTNMAKSFPRIYKELESALNQQIAEYMKIPWQKDM